MTTPTTTNETELKRHPASVLKRIGAFVYDCLLLLAVLFVATAILLPFNRGEAVETGNLFYSIYLVLITFLFFGWFWTHGGQTLGMRAWKIRVEQLDGRDISWGQAIHRFIIMCMTFGLGILWCFTNKDKQAFHDRLSATHVIKTKNLN
jgi:uncharacterized RDD family membrane protein YckC